MKNIFMLMLSLFLAIYSCSSGMSPEQAAEFYAPVIQERMTPLREKSAPRKSDIPFTAYPNSTMLRWGDTVEQGKSFITLSLVTADSQEKVKEYYSEELDGWTFDASLNVYLLDSEAGFMRTNSVTIGKFEAKFHPYDLKYLNKPKTVIDIAIEKTVDNK